VSDCSGILLRAKDTAESGAKVEVVEGKPLFLKSDPDSTEDDNFLHLINYAYIF